MGPKTLAKKIATLALTKKAHDVIIMDLRKLTDMTDYFVICSADSDTQVKAIADTVVDGTELLGESVWHDEGGSQRQWVLLDYVDVVVHVFHKEIRKYYNLEKLWGDAKVEKIIDSIPIKRKKSSTREKTKSSAKTRP